MNAKPHREPAARYADLPDETREFLEDLRPDELALLQRAIRVVLAFGTVGRIAFLAIAGLIGAAAAAFGLIKAGVEVMAIFKGVK